jgi:hypothetical protein
MLRSRLRILAVACVAAAAIACGDDETTPTEPTDTRIQTTDTFEGTLTVNGARTHDFVATGSGEIRLTLTTLSPDSTARIGVSLGTWNGAVCQIVLANDNATQGAVVIGNAAAAGNFCARVQDVGLLSAPTDYSLTVLHF